MNSSTSSDVNGYIVLRKHYDADTVAQLHEGINELQAIPVDYDIYRKIGRRQLLPGISDGRSGTRFLERQTPGSQPGDGRHSG